MTVQRVGLWGSSVETELAETVKALMDGTIELYQLTPSLAEFYTQGYTDGRASLEPRLRDAEYERDRYYERLHNPGKQFAGMVQRRLDDAAERHSSEPDAFTYYEAVLDAATRPRKVA